MHKPCLLYVPYRLLWQLVVGFPVTRGYVHTWGGLLLGTMYR